MENTLPSTRHEIALEGLLAGKSLQEVGKIAGFSTPSRDLVPLIVAPQTRQYVRKRMKGRLEVEGAPAAYVLLYSVMMDVKHDIKLRVEIAKYLYAAAGYTPPKAQDAASDHEKLPSEMTPDELRRFIDEAEAELAQRAIPLNDTQQAIDSLL